MMFITRLPLPPYKQDKHNMPFHPYEQANISIATVIMVAIFVSNFYHAHNQLR